MTHKERIKQDLKRLGVSKYGLLTLESRYLPRLIQPNELLKGVVYGQSTAGKVMLVATDRRILFLDKKPLFVDEDEISYSVVSGVSYSEATIGCSVTLHTRIKDYTISALNGQAAQNFVDYIESRCLAHEVKEGRYDFAERNWMT